jgi:tetratricopeptide (TPR) repeat protein
MRPHFSIACLERSLFPLPLKKGRAITQCASHPSHRAQVSEPAWPALRLFLCLVLSLLAAASRVEAGAFQEGTNAYASGDYTAAAKAFSEAARLQPASGTLQNLGLMEWLRGRRGFAVLAWEQSLWVDPFNETSRENLRFARKEAQLESPELAWYEAASTWLPVNAWAVLAALSFWFAVAMAMLPRILRLRRANWHQALAVAGCAVFLLCLPSLVGVQTRTKIGIVLEGATPLRLTPTQDAQTLLQLAAGEPARIERSRGGYFFIRTSYGRGWIELTKLGRVCPD